MQAASGTATRYAVNGAVRIAYEDLGGAGGDPLLLVMGLGASRFWWPEGFTTTLVSRNFHVVTFDLRDGVSPPTWTAPKAAIRSPGSSAG